MDCRLDRDDAITRCTEEILNADKRKTVIKELQKYTGRKTRDKTRKVKNEKHFHLFFLLSLKDFFVLHLLSDFITLMKLLCEAKKVEKKFSSKKLIKFVFYF